MEQERKCREIDRRETTWREIPWFEPGEWYETEWPWYVVWIKHDWRAITDSRSEAERAAASHPTGRFRGFCRRKEARRAWSSSYDPRYWSMNAREDGLPHLSDINKPPCCATPPSGSTPENPVNLEETGESSSNREVTPKDPKPKDSTSGPSKTPTGVTQRPATYRALGSPPESPISLTSRFPSPFEDLMPDWWPLTQGEETGETCSDRELTPEDPTPEDPTLKQRKHSNGRNRNGGSRQPRNGGNNRPKNGGNNRPRKGANGRQRRVNSSSVPVFSQSSTPATSNIWHREERIKSSSAPVFSQPSTSTSSSQRQGRPKTIHPSSPSLLDQPSIRSFFPRVVPEGLMSSQRNVSQPSPSPSSNQRSGRPRKILSPTKTNSMFLPRFLSQPPTSTSSSGPPATSLDIRGRPMTSASSPALPPSQDTPLMSSSIREVSPSKRARTDDPGDHYSHVEKLYDCENILEAVTVLEAVFGDGNSRGVQIRLLI